MTNPANFQRFEGFFMNPNIPNDSFVL